MPQLRLGDDQALDLVVRGGRAFDPGAGIDGLLDVGIRYGRIVAPPGISRRR